MRALPRQRPRRRQTHPLLLNASPCFPFRIPRTGVCFSQTRGGRLHEGDGSWGLTYDPGFPFIVELVALKGRTRLASRDVPIDALLSL
jgi:hypothetical protein